MGMEVADTGVRTRAQVLAMAKRKKCGDQSEVATSSTFVPLKRPCGSNKKENSAQLATLLGPDHVLEASCRTSDFEQESFLQGDDNVEDVETFTFKLENSDRRETIDTSEPRVDSSSVQLASPEPNPSPAREPPAGEIEKYFVRAENDLEKQFCDKYNYDFAKDVPLEGRYEWVVIKRST